MAKKKQDKKWIKIFLPIIVVLAGLGVVFLFVITRKPPPSGDGRHEGILVETVTAKSTTERPTLSIKGLVVPAKEVALRPQVSGNLVEVNVRLKPGAFFKQGEQLALVDPRPFENQLQEAEARLAEAKASLKLELGRSEIAEADWDYYLENITDNPDTPDTSDRSLALREPQVQIAKARVDSARAAVANAKLNLEYADIKAPFDCVIIEEMVDPGQFVSPQAIIATLAGSEYFWMEAAVPVEDLNALAVPGYNAKETNGSKAIIQRDYNGNTTTRDGRILRLQASLQPQGRMARLLIRITDPFGLKESNDPTPLLLNTYAKAELETTLTGTWVSIPREAVRGGNKVYLFDEGKLRIVTIDILWGTPEIVLVENGIQDGDQLVVTNLSAPVEGMKLRLPSEVQEENDSKQKDSPDA